jgi:16S rRNA U516 pseudouridylate synthase RsuA-like enzyme
MTRTQVELTEAQMKALRLLSAATGKSIDELIRNAIDHLVLRRIKQAEDRAERAIRVAGMFSSGNPDASGLHDRYLAEAFQR